MLPLRWWLHRALRSLLGLVAIAVHLSVFGYRLSGAVVLYAAYAIYGALAFAVEELDGAGQPLAFAIDCGFLFLSLILSFPHSYWIALLFFSYVVGSAGTRYDAWASITVAVLSIVTLNFAQPAGYHILLPALLAGGLLAGIGAAQRQVLRERLARAAEEARKSERQRISADFHDGPLQSLTGFQLRLETIRKLIARNPEQAQEEIAELQNLSNAQIDELRSFVREMRPVAIDRPLHACLRRLIEEFEKECGIQVSFASTEFAEPENTEVALQIVQVVREALFNVRKHAGATRVAVAIEKVDRTIEISVEDNGDGFPFSGAYSLEELELLRLGPGSIKNRVRSLGGELTVDSRPGQGSGLRVRLLA